MNLCYWVAINPFLKQTLILSRHQVFYCNIDHVNPALDGEPWNEENESFTC